MTGMEDPPLADTGTVARVQDALVGGRRGLSRDKDLAAYIARRYPGAGPAVSAARDFHRRAALWAVSGETFAPPAAAVVFCAAGLPLRGGVPMHADAAEASPGARFAYIDRDPKVTGVSRDLLAMPGKVTAATAVPAFPAEVMSLPQVAGLTAAGPVSVHLVLTGVRWSPETARDAAAGYARLMPSGSTLCLSVASPDRDPVTGQVTADAEELMDMLRLTGGPLYPYFPGDIEEWIAKAGLVMHPAGVFDVRRFGRPAPAGHLAGFPATVLGAVALRP